MSRFTRRTFVQLSTGALLAKTRRLRGDVDGPAITSGEGVIRVTARNYVWEYAAAGDTFRLLDAHQRLIASGNLQPAVAVARPANPALHVREPGHAIAPHIEPGQVTFSYEGVNGAARLSIRWRFAATHIWCDPVTYQSPIAEDVVSLHYFVEPTATELTPSLHATYLVVPGISEGSAVSPILRDDVHLNQSIWLGRGSFIPGSTQQWGLPVHYFCGFSLDQSQGTRNLYKDKRSDTFAFGLADLPSGDLFLQMYQGRCSPWINYRSDLWKHMQGPGRFELGATFVWSVAADDRAAIAEYYQGLVDAGIVRKRVFSEKKAAVALTPEFCTWGAQLNRNRNGDRLDEAFLNEMYSELKASGLKAGVFSIDDKWEEVYGSLEHSTTRLPHFEQFLDRLRTDGYKVGLWAALMRSERPADLGLTLDNVLKMPNGEPYLTGNWGGAHYYLLDFTQPVVERVLTALVRQFMRRYKPDLFKFDFGYELPAVSVAAPQDKRWTGERLMWKGLSIVIPAMRQENPDLVVMYYQLSPLFLEYFDLHSTDDLFLAAGEYDLEANRRLYFSSLLGPLGVPSYGSSGYDWASAPNIWFDSVASGTIGSLNDFTDDERGESSTAERVAKYNGLANVVRPACTFQVLPFGVISQAPTYGAHARSWARMEAGNLVLVALRPQPPGDDHSAAAQPADAEVWDAVRAHVPVVVASKGKDGIARSNRLAIVSYGSGEILIRRKQGTHAVVVHHYFPNSAIAGKALIEGGFLRITAAERDAAAHPLEWIEVLIS